MKRIICYLLFFFSSLNLVAQEQGGSMKDSTLIKELFFNGVREKLKENYPLAIINFNKVIDLDSENAAALFELGNINFKQNKLNEAETYLIRASTINSENIWVLKLLAEIYKRTNKMEPLIDLFDKLIILDPNNEAYYYDKSNAYLISGNKEGALKNYDLIEQKFGSSIQVTNARQQIQLHSKEAPKKEEIDKILADNPSEIRNYLYLSNTLITKNKLNEALVVIQKGIAQFPNNYEIYLALADIYRIQKEDIKRYEAIAAAFECADMLLDQKIKIIELCLPELGDAKLQPYILNLANIMTLKNESDAKSWTVLGDLLFNVGDLKGAKAKYLESLKRSDQIFRTWQQAIHVYIELEEYNSAIEKAEEAISFYPNQAILYYLQAFAQHRLGQNEKAIKNCKYALQIDSESKNLQALINGLQAEILIDKNQIAQSDDVFSKAMASDIDNFEIINNYAYYLALKNVNLIKAESLILKALKVHPQNNSFINTYALILFKQNKLGSAKEWISKALQNNATNNPVYLEHLGDVLMQQGESENAVKKWKEARENGNVSDKLNQKINEKKYIK